jgi:transcriptional regulator with XRE-family HTH domain
MAPSFFAMSSVRDLNPRRVFADNVRRVRVERGLSQERLGELTGLHRTYIGSIERAERNVSIDNMGRIARALKTPLPLLLEGV